ncbi:type IV pilus secretin PilQ [Solemya velum gill symbiont]|uniref:type IV pilus secretin PilQ n=1 Tax=Solemya velum gill symbiont TaxID=2340 RepID=UPI0018A84B77|nr:secretin N-terminal domain-containing protein [Solemya velum gill symbiont]
MKKITAMLTGMTTLLLLLTGNQVFADQSLKNVTSTELEPGVVQIVVEGSEPFAATPASFAVNAPPQIVVDLKGSSELDKKLFTVGKSSVKNVVVVESNGRARLVARLLSQQPYEIDTDSNKLIITIGKAASRPVVKVDQEVLQTAVEQTLASEEPPQSAVEIPVIAEEPVSAAPTASTVDSGKLSLNFQDIEVRSVLQLLADFTGLNMVVSDSVVGNVTLRLKDVHWRKALDIILRTKNLTMREDGNIIMVAPTIEVTAQEQLLARSETELQELKPLKSDLIRVKYAQADELADLLKESGASSENSLLSSRGSVTVDSRTSTLLLRDTEGVRLGFDTEEAVNGNTVTLAGGTSDGHLPATGTAGGFISFSIANGLDILDLELAAMQTEEKGEVVSSPRVVTSDQNTAIIKQGVEIPYLEDTSSGATNVTFKDAVLKLEVTPHITPDNKVIMDLIINKDTPNFAEALGLNQNVPIDTQSIETKVLVGDGDTIVLGGIFETQDTKSVDKVPVLGDIPGLGALFRKNTNTVDRSELMIFVTPKILRR